MKRRLPEPRQVKLETKKKMRYNDAGDYYEKDGKIHIISYEFRDEVKVWGVILHELVEYLILKWYGVSWKDVDKVYSGEVEEEKRKLLDLAHSYADVIERVFYLALFEDPQELIDNDDEPVKYKNPEPK